MVTHTSTALGIKKGDFRRFVSGHNTDIQKFNRKHGMSGTRIFWVWDKMLSRCYKKNDKGYHNYGERGIYVCDRWKEFENFYADMGDKPEGLTIERIDNDGPYSPENCRWATRQDQCNNLRKNLKVTHEGITKTLPQWARHYGISYHAIRQRYELGQRSPEIFRPVIVRAKPRRGINVEARA
jgi:hypothetical protein